MSTVVRSQAELDAALKKGKTRIVIDSPESVWLEVTGSSRVTARGSSRVIAGGSSRVEARDSSRVVAGDSSYVGAWDSSRVEARDSSSVGAGDSSRVKAWDSSYVVTRDSSSVEAWGSSRVEAWDFSRVEAWGSSCVGAWDFSHVEARGSSSVEARGSSRVIVGSFSSVVALGSSSVEAGDSSRVVAGDSSRVEARDSSSVVARDSSYVVAWDSSRVEAWDSSRVEASKYAAIHLHSQHVTLSGGVVIDLTDIDTHRVEDFIDYHGVTVEDGWATVYKAVDDDLYAGHSHTPTRYPIGGTVTAPDWDGRHRRGGGLHFGHRPTVARDYFPTATRFLECRVRVDGLIALGDKVKAESCVVVREVDIHGDPVGAVEGKGAASE